VLLATGAGASRTVVVKPGDSIDSLARQYDVSWKDIAEANGIQRDTLLRDGRKLIIPDPPRHVVRPATMRVPGVIQGNRVAVRRGPHENYRRMTLLDHNTPITITHRAGDWRQVQLSDGTIGWVRYDFLTSGNSTTTARSSTPRRVASSKSKPHRDSTRRASNRQYALVEERRRNRRPRVVESREKRRRTRLTSKQRHYRQRVVRHRSPRPEVEAPDSESDVVRTAYGYRGTRYRYGGSSRSGFDCSGFTSYVYSKKGVNLPHSASAQYRQGKQVGKGDMKAGDLVFFTTTRKGISHVGIYVGDGKFVHASSGGGRVRVDSLNTGYYKDRYRGARRVKKD
jgi:cell wall-associated NlpC family hydrolase